jgi:exopolysaccharide biosynthesis protein
VTRLLVAFAVVLLGAAALAAPSQAQPELLFPGVTYEEDVQFTPRGPVAIKIVRGPRPTGVYRLRTVLSNETVVGRETVSSMQRRLSKSATSVGVNGDLWRWADGKPSGIVLRDGVLVHPPHPERSSAGFGLDGTLDVRRVRLAGTWQAGGQRHQLRELNDAPERNQVALFTSEYGPATPRVPGSVAVTLATFPPSVPNADLVAPVVAVARNGPVAIPPGSAVLVARGAAAAALETEAVVGATLTLHLALRPDWAAVSDAIGGGPLLVREGRPVYQANEAFTRQQLVPRHPRTAVGQLADGRVLFVVVDGRQPGYSMGLTTFDMAQTMFRLGAVRAMQLDGGGSSTLAFDGRVLNRPSDGRERAISTAVMLEYYGAYVPPVEPVVSPNGDGVAEEQHLAVKVVRPSDVTVTLTGPDGQVAFTETAAREPGLHAIPFPPPTATAEGRWALSVSATDDQGLASSAMRRFSLNSTLGFLGVRPELLRLRVSGRGAPAAVAWSQARAARVRVTVETPSGGLVRRLMRRAVEPGAQTIVWNGRNANGRLVPSGRYIVRVAASNELGRVELTGSLRVRRPAPRR